MTFKKRKLIFHSIIALFLSTAMMSFISESVFNNLGELLTLFTLPFIIGTFILKDYKVEGRLFMDSAMTFIWAFLLFKLVIIFGNSLPSWVNWLPVILLRIGTIFFAFGLILFHEDLTKWKDFKEKYE
ncbi:hypothetical protein GOV04_01930 [Candidatus Woesearchaeota archaeon]|nr:hypothetical protein [Candidatus Woesearchaeota archaeon]